MKPHLLRNLQALGLTDAEATVFLALTERGPSALADLANQASLAPATALVALDGLISRGLVHLLEHASSTEYAAEEPSQLNLLVERHRRQLREKEAVLKDTVPELASILTKGDRPVMKTYVGADGFFAMEEDGKRNRKKNALAYSFTALDLLQDYQREYFDRHAQDRATTHERLQVIYTHRDGPQPFATDPHQLRETKYVPREKYPFESSVVIRPWWGLRIYSFSEEKGFIGLTIESLSLARTLQSVFELLWQTLPDELPL